MLFILGFGLSFVFLFLAFLHVYWLLGGKWASNGVIPTKNNSIAVKMPGVFPTLVVAVGLICFALLVLHKSTILEIPIPLWLNNYAVWGIGILFILRAIGEFKFVGFFKTIKDTPFAQKDSTIYSPLCLAIGVLCCILASIAPCYL